MLLVRTAASLLVCLTICICAGCSNHREPKPSREDGVPINITSITGIHETQIFTEVQQARMLPKSVLTQFGPIADVGQPFNATDVVDDNLPSHQLVAAALSKQYCIVSYWQGGITVNFRTAVFELSNDNARVIWLSNQQGGLNFRDLKAMIESGRMHNDLNRGL